MSDEIVVPCVFDPQRICQCPNRAENLKLFQDAGEGTVDGTDLAIRSWQLSQISEEAAKLLQARYPVRFSRCAAYGMANTV